MSSYDPVHNPQHRQHYYNCLAHEKKRREREAKRQEKSRKPKQKRRAW